MEMIRATTIPSPCNLTSRPHLSSHGFLGPKPLSVSLSPGKATRIPSRRFQIVRQCIKTNLKTKAADMAEDLRSASIFLVGMKSLMKTYTGQVLAETFDYCFLDSDSLVEETFGGESAAQSAEEEDYSKSETEVLNQLSSMGQLVVCVGDGAVKSMTNLALLRRGISIWLDIPAHVLGYEFPPDSLAQEVVRLATTINELRPKYEIADVTVSLEKIAKKKGRDVEFIREEDLVMEMLVQLEKLIRHKKMREAAAKPF